MTEVFHFSSSPNTPSSSSLSCANPPVEEKGDNPRVIDCDIVEEVKKEREKQSRDQLSLLALLFAIFRKSFVACSKSERRELCAAMEISWPTNVRHVAHVTFDRFNGFLGLPEELEPELSTGAPSASATVFGVSTESMQLSYDHRGNCVPTIILLMQSCLYAQGGLQAEGIFRITAENSEEEFVREQLNSGVVPENIDVHCLAGLIKAWFRELPSGVLDSLTHENVMECRTEEDSAELLSLLPATEASLLDWAVNLMADVVQHQHINKMNARNVATVFAPNMTQMADPLNALMYAVQVMNFLRTLIERTLRQRQDSSVDPQCPTDPSDENGPQSPSQSSLYYTVENYEETEETFISEVTDKEAGSNDRVYESSTESDNDEDITSVNNQFGDSSKAGGRSKSTRFVLHPPVLPLPSSVGKTRIRSLSCVDSKFERIESWR